MSMTEKRRILTEEQQQWKITKMKIAFKTIARKKKLCNYNNIIGYSVLRSNLAFILINKYIIKSEYLIS